MNINWYPGHMTKAKRMMNENLKLVDIVIELLDARIPKSSSNPDFQSMFQNKIRVAVLNKSDYADDEKTKLWVNYHINQSITAAAINSLNKKDIQQLKKTLFAIADEKQKEIKQRKGINKTIRAMVAGIPNVGKSTLINAISGSAKAKTGDRPGITKAKQWVKINPYFELLDTPGLLWPKLNDEKTGLHLAYTGSIREEIMDMAEIAVRFLEEMTELYPQLLKSRYRLENLDKKAYDLLADIALNRGWLQTGGIPDISRAARQVLDEYRSGAIGRTTLELPGKK